MYDKLKFVCCFIFNLEQTKVRSTFTSENANCNNKRV